LGLRVAGEVLMRDPFKIDSPTCISFSGGRTSAYMLWRVLQSNGGLPDEAVVCFANTGKEDEATLQFVQDCAANWGVAISWVEFRNDAKGFCVVDVDTASRKGEPFAALIEKKSYLPNPVARFCTEELKVKAINKYLASIGLTDVDMMVGVRSDEPRRVPKLRQRGLLVPLVDAGVTEHDVHAFWKASSFDLRLEFMNGVTALGNCDLCFLKGPHQIIALIQNKPERAQWWADQEKKIGATFRSDRPSYASMMEFSNDQADMFGHEETIACFCGD
jgi:3'-phosphoadenosine 5'-phosphosulfate sulfotransferase (PAPS reductase)/FAD synthetase